jgi:hypothetical protein
MIRTIIIFSAVMLLSAMPVLAKDFNHTEHLTYLDDDSTCSTCHLAEAASIQPATKACLECHEQEFIDEVAFPGLKSHGPTWSLNHRPVVKLGSIDCSACHEQKYCLECHKSGFADEMGQFGNNMINVHRSDFDVTHPIAARTDPQLCSSCHEVQFCVDCHNAFAPADLAILSHRRGFTDGTLGGAHASFDVNQCQGCHIDSVLPAHDWSNRHAREARKNLATCQACHPEGDICLTCHSAVSGLRVNPHPKDWDNMKDRLNDASGGRTCRKCH